MSPTTLAAVGKKLRLGAKCAFTVETAAYFLLSSLTVVAPRNCTTSARPQPAGPTRSAPQKSFGYPSSRALYNPSSVYLLIQVFTSCRTRQGLIAFALNVFSTRHSISPLLVARPSPEWHRRLRRETKPWSKSKPVLLRCRADEWCVALLCVARGSLSRQMLGFQVCSLSLLYHTLPPSFPSLPLPLPSRALNLPWCLLSELWFAPCITITVACLTESRRNA